MIRQVNHPAVMSRPSVNQQAQLVGEVTMSLYLLFMKLTRIHMCGTQTICDHQCRLKKIKIKTR
jgi:hypothetical protein